MRYRLDHKSFARNLLAAAALLTLVAGCAIAPPRTDDPLQTFNRKMYAFNRVTDRAVLRPVAKAYVKVTGPKGRVLIGNFFANLRTPVTIANELLQGHPGSALQSSGRLFINTSLGFLGFFDIASEMHLPAHPTDFGVTLARWGVPEGPYLVLPFFGPTTLRDVWRFPVDNQFDPLGHYARRDDLRHNVQYLPTAAYLVTLRASALPIDSMLDSSFDPYAFMRDAYRQHRLYEVYLGNPPLSAIEILQGSSPSESDNLDIDELLQQQQQYQASQAVGSGAVPAVAASAALPATATSSAVPASASSGG